MRRTWIIATLLGGVLLILSACTSPVIATPAPAIKTPKPATATPVPASTTLVSSAPAVTTPVAPAPAPGQANFMAGDLGFIVQVTPTPGQSGFLVSQLQLDPEEVELGENVTVSIVVTNTGEQRGTYTVDLKFDDAIIGTQDITIDAGSSRKVALNVIPAVPCGEYKVMADKLTARLRVLW